MVVRLDGGLTMLLPKIPYFTDLIHLQDCLKIGAISKKEICPMEIILPLSTMISGIIFIKAYSSKLCRDLYLLIVMI